MVATWLVAFLKFVSQLEEVQLFKKFWQQPINQHTDKSDNMIESENDNCSTEDLNKFSEQLEEEDELESRYGGLFARVDSSELYSLELELDIFFKEPTKFQQIIYCIECYAEQQERDTLKKLFNFGVLGIVLASILALASFVENITIFLWIRNAQRKAVRIFLYCLNYFTSFSFYIANLICCIPYLIVGEGYIMQRLFQEHEKDTEQICEQNSAPELQFPHYCTICMEAKQEYYMAALNSCSHRFCKRCLAQYVEVCLLDRRYPLPCPQCSVPLSFKNVNRIVQTARNSDQLQKFLKKYYQDDLVVKKQAIYCPNPYCESIIKTGCQIDTARTTLIQNKNKNQIENQIQFHEKSVDQLKSNDNQFILNDILTNFDQSGSQIQNQENQQQTSYLYNTIQNNRLHGSDVILVSTKKKEKKLCKKCLVCRTTICTKCKCIQHDGLTCEEFQFLNRNSKMDVQMTLLFHMAERLGFGQCPECKQLVEKNYGCDHIVCYCGHEFLIDRNAIRHGQYYERPLWMYGKNINQNFNPQIQQQSQQQQQQKQSEQEQFQWLDVNLFQNYDELYHDRLVYNFEGEEGSELGEEGEEGWPEVSAEEERQGWWGRGSIDY